jgi:hypothetical protein
MSKLPLIQCRLGLGTKLMPQGVTHGFSAIQDQLFMSDSYSYSESGREFEIQAAQPDSRIDERDV